ncbi:WD40 repeat-like protein [Fomitopsis betulina]|nr:WD40 repeat-like protein [Fomitopsis betulina]
MHSEIITNSDHLLQVSTPALIRRYCLHRHTLLEDIMTMSYKRRRISSELRPATTPHARSDTCKVATVEALFDVGLPYSRKLCGHTECVNALTLSRSGRWLASGGDDPRILLWDFHQGDLKEPSQCLLGHRSNIFALEFSTSNKYLYSGATDNTIHRYDVEYACTSKVPVPYGLHVADTIDKSHKDGIRDLSCHPQQDEIFLSASDDGCTMLHDMRATSTLTRAQGTLQHDAEMTSVQFHPEMEHIFVTSDSRGELCLRDMRMAFGPRSRRMNKGVVRKFVTTIAKPTVQHLSNPEVSSVTFDRTGMKLAATMTYFGPTIYQTSDPYPIAVCAATTLPDGSPIPEGERTYANSCTIKHGSFGGGSLPDDPYYCAGSDDFRAYLWKLSPSAELAQQRREVKMDDWSSEDPNTVAFAEHTYSPRHIPMTLSQPTTRLTGHLSIVNTALMHPTFPAILTAGIERNILVHSPTPATPFLPSGSLTVTPPEVRALPVEDTTESRRLVLLGMSSAEPEDDSMSITLFDQYVPSMPLTCLCHLFDCRILRQEGCVDVFQARRCDNEYEDEEMDIDHYQDSGNR